MATEPQDAEYWKKKIAALETFLCWVQTGQRKFDGYDLFVDNTLNIMRQIRPVAQVDYQGRAVPIGLLPDSEGTKHQQVGTHGRAFVEDPWGPVVSVPVRTPHSAGTTIEYTLTVPAGSEWLLHEVFSLASRAPDVDHLTYFQRATAAPANVTTGVLINETTALTGYWPNSDESSTHSLKFTVSPIVMKAGDLLYIRVSNNSQAGDTLDTIVTYQSRSVE